MKQLSQFGVSANHRFVYGIGGCCGGGTAFVDDGSGPTNPSVVTANGDCTWTHDDGAGTTVTIDGSVESRPIADTDLGTAGSPVITDIINFVTANSISKEFVYYIGSGSAQEPEYVWFVDCSGDIVSIKSPSSGGITSAAFTISDGANNETVDPNDPLSDAILFDGDDFVVSSTNTVSLKCNENTEITDTDLVTAGDPQVTDISAFATANNLADTYIYYIGSGDANTPQYMWYVDCNGNIVTVASSAPGDETPPTLTASSTENVTGVTAETNFTYDEDGNYYWVLVPGADTAPTSAEVIAAQSSGGGTPVDSGNGTMTAGTNIDVNLTGLSGGSDYCVYIVGVDAAGNESTVSSECFTTTLRPFVWNSSVTAAANTSYKSVGFEADGSDLLVFAKNSTESTGDNVIQRISNVPDPVAGNGSHTSISVGGLLNNAYLNVLKDGNDFWIYGINAATEGVLIRLSSTGTIISQRIYGPGERIWLGGLQQDGTNIYATYRTPTSGVEKGFAKINKSTLAMQTYPITTTALGGYNQVYPSHLDGNTYHTVLSVNGTDAHHVEIDVTTNSVVDSYIIGGTNHNLTTAVGDVISTSGTSKFVAGSGATLMYKLDASRNVVASLDFAAAGAATNYNVDFDGTHFWSYGTISGQLVLYKIDQNLNIVDNWTSTAAPGTMRWLSIIGGLAYRIDADRDVHELTIDGTSFTSVLPNTSYQWNNGTAPSVGSATLTKSVPTTSIGGAQSEPSAASGLTSSYNANYRTYTISYQR